MERYVAGAILFGRVLFLAGAFAAGLFGVGHMRARTDEARTFVATGLLVSSCAAIIGACVVVFVILADYFVFQRL